MKNLRLTSTSTITTRRRILHSTVAGATMLCMGLLSGTTALAQGAKVLTVGGPIAPLSMDPALSGNGRAGLFLSPAYEPLIRTLADGKFAPGLAIAWSLSADSKEAMFTIRQDAKFSDGEPVTAEAVKKSIEYWRAKKGGPFTANLATVTSIDVVDKTKVRIRVSAPQPNLLNLFDAYWNVGDIISPKGVDAPEQLANKTFGAGPYKLDNAATITGKSYTYVPNEHYYDKSRIKWDKVVISVFEDQNSAISAVKAGQVKFLVSDPFTANQNSKNLPSDVQIISNPAGWSGLILMDRDGQVQPELKDVRVRQAINYALDRKLLSSALFGQFGEPLTQLQGKGFGGNDPKLEERYTYNPAKAKQLLAAAGYKDGFDLKIAYVNNTLSVFQTQALAGQLKKVGINVKPTELANFGAMLAGMRAKTISGLVFNSNFGVPNLARFQTLDPKGNLNFYGSEDAELSKLVAEAAGLPADKANASWQKVYGRAVELAWFAPVAATHVVYFASKSVKAPKAGQSFVIDLIDVVPAQ